MNSIIESIQKDLKDLNRKYCCLLTSSQSLLTVTKAELDTLITNETLIPGQLYKVTGVDTALYGGTDILIKAATNSELELSGHGIFYNPKYLNSSLTPENGYGVYNNYIFYSLTSRVNTINDGEIVTANNGATAKFRNYGVLELLTGSWVGVTSFSVGAKSAVITIVSTPTSYSIDDNVIWGGRHWINKTGNIGTITNTYTLDSTNWEIVTFNDTDYNIEIDEISYDYQNDLIVSRKDRWNNIVSFSKNILFYYTFGSPIKNFQWGNYPENNTSGGQQVPGVFNNSVSNSILSCINFRGRNIFNNILTGYSEFSTLITDNRTTIYNNILDESYVYNNTFLRTEFYSNNLSKQSAVYNNVIVNDNYRTYIYYNILGTFSAIRNNTKPSVSTYTEIFNNELVSAYIQSNTLADTSFLSNNLNVTYIEGCNLIYSNFIGNVFNNNCQITNAIFDNTHMLNNNWMATSFNFAATGLLANKDIKNTKSNGIFTSANFSAATILFGNYTKELFRNSASVEKISYYNASDVLTVVNLNA
jgi:hypothetical protein